MKITFLGTGTSTGVPVLTCKCEVCTSLDYRDKRLRSSIFIETQQTHILVDAGPDFRQQALRENISKIDAVLFTHEHKDHTGGLDDVRPYNYLSGIKRLPIYAHTRVLEQLKNEYYYAFQTNAYAGSPLIDCHEIRNEDFKIGELKITPIDVLHLNLQVFGFRIKDFCYVTDANFISDIELEKMKNSEVLVLNALQKKEHPSHYNLDQAIELSKKLAAKRTIFTHLSHNMGNHKEVSKQLPEGIEIAYDGLSVVLND